MIILSTYYFVFCYPHIQYLHVKIPISLLVGTRVVGRFLCYVRGTSDVYNEKNEVDGPE